MTENDDSAESDGRTGLEEVKQKAAKNVNRQAIR
jgi:hypothetical protein